MKIKMSSFTIESLLVGVAPVNSDAGGKNNKKFNMIGSDNQINVAAVILLTNPFTQITNSSLIFIPSYQEALEIMLLVRTEDIPMSPVPIHDLIPRILPVETHMSIHVNYYQCSVPPWFPSFGRIIPIYFLLISLPSVCPLLLDHIFV